MNKCRTHRCHAACCYNLVFANYELTRFGDKIVTPVLGVTEIAQGAYLPWTVEVEDSDNPDKVAEAMLKNKCPFLKDDLTCNIYEYRPDVCRKYGQIPQLQCKYIKP